MNAVTVAIVVLVDVLVETIDDEALVSEEVGMTEEAVMLLVVVLSEVNFVEV